ncbi:MAG: response regulator transcription factor [Bacteroidota bacterium]|nr:response regulator transcription factor [Bacteroidota bacterium]
MGEIKVAIADDHKIFRKGVILSLRHYSNLRFVLEAENGQQLLDGLKEAKPNVILMDLRMPVKDGIETTKYISIHHPDIFVLILTMHEEEKFVIHLMENGANGYLLKSSDPVEIKKAITDVVEKGYYLNNFVNRILLKKTQAKNKPAPSLTKEIEVSPREKEVLEFICLELTSQEIGDKMGISSRTVESIKERLMERFGLKNTAGLVFFAVKNNLID